MDDICRLCLKPVNSDQQNGIKIHERDIESGEPISNIIKSVIPELYLGLSIGPQICVPCHEALKEAYNFRVKCLRTEKIIGIYIRELQPRTLGTTVALSDVVDYWKDLYVNKRTELDVARANLAEWFGLDDVDFGKREPTKKRFMMNSKMAKLATNPNEIGTPVDGAAPEVPKIVGYFMNVVNKSTGLKEFHRIKHDSDTGSYCMDCYCPVKNSGVTLEHLGTTVVLLEDVSEKKPPDEPIMIIDDNSIEMNAKKDGQSDTAYIKKDISTNTTSLLNEPKIKIPRLNHTFRLSKYSQKLLPITETSKSFSGQTTVALPAEGSNPLVLNSCLVLAPSLPALVPVPMEIPATTSSVNLDKTVQCSKPKNGASRRRKQEFVDEQFVSVNAIRVEPQASEDDRFEIKFEPLDPLGVVEDTKDFAGHSSGQLEIAIGETYTVTNTSSLVDDCIEITDDDDEELDIPEYVIIKDVGNAVKKKDLPSLSKQRGNNRLKSGPIRGTPSKRGRRRKNFTQ